MRGDENVSGRRALVLTGGPPPVGVGDLPDVDIVIAADRGADHAVTLGITVDLLVGDLDSVSDAGRQAARRVEQHPAAKDDTDLELALAAALAHGCDAATVVTTSAGRVDHAIGNLLTVAADRWAGLDIDLVVDGARGWVVRGQLDVDLPVGSTVSLLAVGGPAGGITTTGLAWTLDDDTLEPGVGRGISNRSVDPRVTVAVEHGVLIVVAPGAGSG